MYLEHFGLSEAPFRITPHTDFFYSGGGRGAMLDALLYALLNEEGIVTITGEVGSGKTMLCRMLMERMPAHVETIYVATPSLGRDEILDTIAEELQVGTAPGSRRTTLRALQERLIASYAAGRRVIILIDEAHAMPEETLEQVRLLSNLESSRHKLLQIVLFGQPELDETLARPALRPLRERVTQSFNMRPLPDAEVGKYLAFRMSAAGYRGPDVFTPRARSLICEASQGLTRRINILADKSLLAAFARGTHLITGREARAAVADAGYRRPRRIWRSAGLGAAALLAGVAIGALGHRALAPEPAAPRAVAAQAPERAPEPAAASSAPAAPRATALTREQRARVAGYAPGANPLLAERIAATVERLEREPDASIGIELFFSANSDAARLERFLQRARNMKMSLADLYVLPVAAEEERYRIRVFHGAYPSRAAAREAERGLPQKYQRTPEPLLRTYAELRRAL